jgi:hypothetical protein
MQMVAQLVMLPLYFLLLEMNQAVVLYLVTSSNATAAAFTLAPWFAKHRQPTATSPSPGASGELAALADSAPSSGSTTSLVSNTSRSPGSSEHPASASNSTSEHVMNKELSAYLRMSPAAGAVDGTRRSIPSSDASQGTMDAARVSASATGGDSKSAEMDREEVKQADECLNKAMELRYQRDFGAALLSDELRISNDS